MSVLCWDKPKKAIPKEDWMSLSADIAPPGVYSPNMSDTDRDKWKAKLVGHKVGHPCVEIRKAAGALMVIVVSLKGRIKNKWAQIEEDTNVRISANGPIQLTFDGWQEMKRAVEEARERLMLEAEVRQR